jgi:hypothetical protein
MKKLNFSLLMVMASLWLSVSSANAANENVLILLQENGSSAFLTSWITDAQTRSDADRVIDALAETFSNFNVKIKGEGRYDRIISLTDVNCTKAKLLQTLKAESDANNVIDLLILGHGTTNQLKLKNEILTDQNIRQMKTDYGNRNFKLRLVYMCNCKSASLNDDWLAVGAKTSVGISKNNYMPEPQITWFLDDFVLKNKTALEAANNSWSYARPFFTPVPRYQNIEDGSTLIDCSKPTVAGDVSLRFDTRRLAVGESKTYTIKANVTHNMTRLYMLAGERYKFSVSTADKWKNGGTETNASGYQPGILDGGRRQTAYNMMALVGELFRRDDNTSYQNNHFRIGTSATYTAQVSGFLICHGNDNIAFYGDNTGQVTLTIERLSN